MDDKRVFAGPAACQQLRSSPAVGMWFGKVYIIILCWKEIPLHKSGYLVAVRRESERGCVCVCVWAGLGSWTGRRMAHDAQGKEDAGRTRSTLHRDDEPPTMVSRIR